MQQLRSAVCCWHKIVIALSPPPSPAVNLKVFTEVCGACPQWLLYSVRVCMHSLATFCVYFAKLHNLLNHTTCLALSWVVFPCCITLTIFICCQFFLSLVLCKFCLKVHLISRLRSILNFGCLVYTLKLIWVWHFYFETKILITKVLGK